ncbi:MAG: protein-glutamate O-methyltransferase [Pseudomonadota bacterium]
MNTARASATLSEQRSFELTDIEFEQLRDAIKLHTGITLGDNKRQMVYRRLSDRLRERNLRSFSEYLSILKRGDTLELEAFRNSVTTNLTSFFREQHHFDTLRDTLLPNMYRRSGSERRIRIWSAGCSTGEESYSLAFTVADFLSGKLSCDAKILCTDIDTDVLATAERGVYPIARIDSLNDEQRARWFQKRETKNGMLVRARDHYRDLLSFRQLNLLSEWPFKQKFDVIFCRNTIIYFDRPTQQRIVNRFADALDRGGHLILGHSESLHELTDRFELIGNTVYHKVR